jgi:lactate dehydrogenase-like 2-hydroxyacid dehydrogenase
MTATMPTHSDNRFLIGRDEINDLDEILAITNTDRDETISPRPKPCRHHLHLEL